MPDFINDNLKKCETERDAKLAEFIRTHAPTDTAAIDQFAADMVNEVCRAAFRDIAENYRRMQEAEGKTVDVSKLAEQAQPDPEYFRERVKEFKETIFRAFRSTGKLKGN